MLFPSSTNPILPNDMGPWAACIAGLQCVVQAMHCTGGSAQSDNGSAKLSALAMCACLLLVRLTCVQLHDPSPCSCDLQAGKQSALQALASCMTWSIGSTLTKLAGANLQQVADCILPAAAGGSLESYRL